ncbi:type II CRISPR RNA-guided endonuclease Cas9 [Zavarzinia sp.]|uniref:type II CRISPR RNA-guided endonuclease Cas9 n=1 Tax=Zavarzinia sp. TaxID=2027920 RepID=UPI00356377DF
MADRSYRLGLDLGSNSLGWFVIWLDEEERTAGLGLGGVRVYPDGRDERSRESNAMARRLARSLRRRRDRYVRRRAAVMAALIEAGLMPAEAAARKALEALDPYELRAAALGGPLPFHHIGRALFHIDQRRGFLSNRRTDKTGGEDGLIKSAAGRLRAAMEERGAPTLGHFMAGQRRAGRAVRTRKRGSGAKAAYDFYPQRDMLLAEFEAIWRVQAGFHPALTQAWHDRLRDLVFYQRPLRPVPAGKCTLLPAVGPGDEEGFRCPRAHPLAQRFRIWQEVRNLRVQVTGQPARPLTLDEGNKVAAALLGAAKVDFDRMRSLLKLPAEARFNLESEKRDHLKGDEAAEVLSRKKYFGKAWRSLPLDRQIEIVTALLKEEDERALVDWLVRTAGVGRETAQAVAGALLPEGYARLGLRAIRLLLPKMEGGLDYAAACEAALGKSHSGGPASERRGRLPYYGEWLQDDVLGTGEPGDPPEKRFGRLPNPTVHIGLGQVRRVVNALIERLGPPAQVVVEMTRDFRLSPRKLAEVEREQAANQRRNDARRSELQTLGYPVTSQNLLKLRLWEELNFKDPADRRCPYTGEQIGIRRLLSDEVEVDHLIPFKTSFDDSPANKTVAMRYANRAKGKRTPHEAFGSSPPLDGHAYSWPDITARAALMPRNKRWRFAPDALERFAAEGGFLARQLNETGWLARMAKDYLAAVVDRDQVWVVPGKLTALLRAKWGLNFSDAKDRNDHRHHGIDALIAGLTSRSLLQAIASANEAERERVEIPLPWPALRDEVAAWRAGVTVSHRPDHGVAGRLHEETAYGLVADPAAEEGRNLVYRKAFTALTERELGAIRDRRLRDMVLDHWGAAKAAGVKLDQALRDFAATVAGRDPHVRGGIRHVRLLKPEREDYLVPVMGPDGKPYKAYAAGENAFVDVVETSAGKWLGVATSVFLANRPGYRPAWADDPSLTFVMRVHKGDLLRLDRDGRSEVMVVRQLDAASGRFKLAGHAEAGKLQDRHDDPDDPFRWLMASYGTLKAMGAERVRVDELGTVWRIPAEEGLRHLQRMEQRRDRPRG